ncbi:type II toxin-antitoxin system PemK/MazF family toxin [Microbacterium sp. H1-D42]|uniref:type II toxin-antitoxin system PemK/MazF family toxin n=1 Tax=Microbacterium sp. H1-D42 TaxID=2925844 RepID=UPI001F53B081|nr:type II toxin-antitoxin system PemK/MazF family toxin [Microbacterium sp. H1-D42]UNK69912.1 type II toxin-antitoxin system PemK/MazF family toxin [Microbacterium sp. H1-D42]
MDPDPTVGREQAGRRPAVVVAGGGYLHVVDALAIIVPVTSVDRRWPNHVQIRGLGKPSWAMTEQLRAVSRDRLHGDLGRVNEATFLQIRNWLRDHLDL